LNESSKISVCRAEISWFLLNARPHSQIRRKSIRSGEAYFWAIHEEAELDLLHFDGGKRRGHEFKYTDSPKPTRSMRGAIDVLGLDSLTVVHPRGGKIRIDDTIEVVPVTSM
jgi:hypothetical protein